MQDPNKLVEMILDEEVDGVFAISFVSDPAIQSDFIALSTDTIKLKILNEEKRLVTGAILIPDLKILRIDPEGNPYHIYFSKETVERISQKYLYDHNQKSVTVEHQAPIRGVTMVESWIKTDDINDKSVALGIDTPVGTWLGTFKVDNDLMWNEIVKTGMVRGFSVEAELKSNDVQLNKSENMDNNEMDNKTLFEKLVEFFSNKEEVKEPEAQETEVTAQEIKDAPVVDMTEDPAPEYVTKEQMDEFMQKVTEMLKPAEPTEVKDEVEMSKEEEPEMISLTDESKIKSNGIEWKSNMTTADRIKYNLLKDN